MKIAEYKYRFSAIALTDEMLRGREHHFYPPGLYYGYLYLRDVALNINYRVCSFYSADPSYDKIIIAEQNIHLPEDVEFDISQESFAPLKVRKMTFSRIFVKHHPYSDPHISEYIFSNISNILDFLEPET